MKTAQECVGVLLTGQAECAMQLAVCYRQINCHLPPSSGFEVAWSDECYH